MLLASSGVSGSASKMYVDDLFSVQLRTGNGGTQSIATGFQPDLVWTKSRSAATGHRLVDSVRGAGNSLESNSTLQQQSEATGITAFTSTGYSVGADSDYNTNSATHVDWVCKKAPKFFDVVTWVGNGTGDREIPHTLGVAPGMIALKNTSSSSNWFVYHRSTSTPNNDYLFLHATDGSHASGTNNWNVTSTTFRAASLFNANNNGQTYVAYLFAHDTSTDGIIQCGSFTTDASGNATVNSIGWEPQSAIIKAASTTGDWLILDSMRGWNMTTNDAVLKANSSGAESTTTEYGNPTATGFDFKGGSANATYTYTVIRRPNKPPTTGTQVYNAIARTGTGAAATVTGVGFAPDFASIFGRNAGYGGFWFDRLRGRYLSLYTPGTGVEASTATGLTSFDQDGISLGSWGNTNDVAPYINHFFRRAPGFFSTFAYPGNGSNTTQNHDLAAIPDLLIVKSRSAATDWQVWCNGLAANEKLVLNSTAGKVTDATAWNSTLPTSTNISLGTASATNANTATFIAYAFSNLPGIQKIGTYVGDGTSGRVIDCGFSTGARFVCIKAISTTGSWLVADSTRGIVSGNDPYLQLNSTAAEVTTEDWLDPTSIGFIVNNVASSNANTNGVTYMFWAIS